VLASRGRDGAIKLPRPMLTSNNLDFSFSGAQDRGIDAGASRSAGRRSVGATEARKADIARESQAAIVDVLVAKSIASDRCDRPSPVDRGRRRRCQRGIARTLRAKSGAAVARVFFPIRRSAPITAR